MNHHSYAIGGNSNAEYLGPPDKLRNTLSSNTCETCNTYNMLKLTRHLFAWNPQAAQMDFYERAYFNHILGSQDPSSGMMTYFMPLASGSSRRYSSPWDDFTCCHGSGLENHTKHGDSAYFHHGSDTLWVNLFMPTDLNWRAAKTKLRQETNFPGDGKVTLTIEDGGRNFEMRLRHPGWATSPIEYRVNGQVVATSNTPSSYVSIKRDWKKGDRLEFVLPMGLHEAPMPDDPNRVAAMFGPLVLAADLGKAELPEPRTPVLVTTGQPIETWLKPTGTPLEFEAKDAGRPSALRFRPFYQFHHNRYAVYFDQFTEPQWQTAEAQYRAEEERRRDLEARTVDLMTIGQMQPERDHNLQSERNDVREANDRTFRTPLSGGWCSFEMKVDAEKPVDLVLSHWGNDRIRPDYEILVDGKSIAAETLADKPFNRFYDTTYAIPQTLTKGKSKVTVRIQPHDGKTGPSLIGARVVRRN